MNATINIRYNQILTLALQLPDKHKEKLGRALTESIRDS